MSPRESPVTIRPFDGSAADAEGLLAVERATFNESPYSAAEVRAMLLGGRLRAWLAVQGESVGGFAIGFLAMGLRGPWWEVDLLAVRPDWRGLRLGHRLVEAAVAYGASLAREARAIVADDNSASEQAFLRAGFQVAPGRRELLILRHGEAARRHQNRWGGGVEAASRREVLQYLASLTAPWASPAVQQDGWEPANVESEAGGQGLTLVLARPGGSGAPGRQPCGYAELIEVQTLLYRGIWIESLSAATPSACAALVERAVCLASDAGLDEVGAVIPEQDQPLRRALVEAGFRSLGGFRCMVTRTPDGRASS